VNRTAVVSMGRMPLIVIASLLTACVAQVDPYLRRGAVLEEAQQPADALEVYEGLISRTPYAPAAFEARARAAYVLADAHPERARACARVVEKSDSEARVRGAAIAFLARTPPVAGQPDGPDQTLCDTSRPADTEQVRLTHEKTRASKATSFSSAAPKPTSAPSMPKPATSTSTSTSSPSVSGSGTRSSGNCHWVSGYTKRNGTRVRGHMRCR